MRNSSRILWIDFLRGLAVLGMIEAHSVNSFLDPVYRVGERFAVLSYINGGVAPTFLFIAGLMQGAWVRKNWDAAKPIAPKLRHLGVILLIGYGLQFPWDQAFDWAKVSVALGKVDVLHCIAPTCAAVLLLSRCCKKRLTFDWLLAVLAIALVIAAPFGWNAPLVLTSSNPLIGYLSPHRGALFPILPWSAYLLAGALTSRLLVKTVATKLTSTTPSPQPGLSGTATIAALALSAIGWFLKLTFTDVLSALPYAARADAFLFRLAIVFFGCALCATLLTNDRPNRAVRAINWCGSRSLPLYVWHLILLHSGLGILPPLRSLFSKTQSPMEVAWLFPLVLIGSITLTLAWQWIACRICLPLSSFGRKPTCERGL